MDQKKMASMGGKARWSKVSKKERSKIMSDTAKKLWKKIQLKSQISGKSTETRTD